MRFEWDEGKSKRNELKHGISFQTAILAFYDPFAVSNLDLIEGGEERWHTIARVKGIAILLVVHTHFDDAGEEVTRIITARRATPREKRIYEDAIQNI
jgi:uncharacterized DUF497 family protein